MSEYKPLQLLDKEYMDSVLESIHNKYLAYLASSKYGGFPTYQAYLNSGHWQEVRQAALERAGNRCMLCNRGDQTLHGHHRTYERLGREEPEDVIVLCATHHSQFHNRDDE